jgi:uncharacterized protein YjbI with pentapeptide repeats
VANSDHIEKLRAGAEAWNQWRAADPNVLPDLSGEVIRDLLLQGLNFSKVNLSRCEFVDIKLEDANFTGATLPETTFRHGASLINCDFTNATFSETRFEAGCLLVRCTFQASPTLGPDRETIPTPIRNISFRRARCEKCQFAGVFADVPFDLAEIDTSKFIVAELRDCTFKNTTATHCEFVDAKLIGGSAQEARFISCDFRGASFESMDLFGTELTNTDLRGARGYEFDDNLARGVILAPEASDRWSVLRRAYTGARFGFNAVFLLLFFLPIIGKAVFWAELAEIDTAAARLQSELQKIADALAVFPYPGVAQLATTLHNLAAAGLCGARHCVSVPLVLLLFGWPARFEAESILGYLTSLLGAMAAPALLVYNLLRGVLTFFVLPMRDEEMRSGHTPRWKWRDARWGPGQRGITPVPVGFFERIPGGGAIIAFFARLRGRYGWLVPLHRAVQVLAYVAYTASAIHFSRLLVSVISLPG